MNNVIIKKVNITLLFYSLLYLTLASNIYASSSGGSEDSDEFYSSGYDEPYITARGESEAESEDGFPNVAEIKEKADAAATAPVDAGKHKKREITPEAERQKRQRHARHQAKIDIIEKTKRRGSRKGKRTPTIITDVHRIEEQIKYEKKFMEDKNCFYPDCVYEIEAELFKILAEINFHGPKEPNFTDMFKSELRTFGWSSNLYYFLTQYKTIGDVHEGLALLKEWDGDRLRRYATLMLFPAGACVNFLTGVASPQRAKTEGKNEEKRGGGYQNRWRGIPIGTTLSSGPINDDPNAPQGQTKEDKALEMYKFVLDRLSAVIAKYPDMKVTIDELMKSISISEICVYEELLNHPVSAFQTAVVEKDSSFKATNPLPTLVRVEGTDIYYLNANGKNKAIILNTELLKNLEFTKNVVQVYRFGPSLYEFEGMKKLGPILPKEIEDLFDEVGVKCSGYDDALNRTLADPRFDIKSITQIAADMKGKGKAPA